LKQTPVSLGKAIFALIVAFRTIVETQNHPGFGAPFRQNNVFSLVLTDKGMPEND
jgi:hypothetical protein